MLEGRVGDINKRGEKGTGQVLLVPTALEIALVFTPSGPRSLTADYK